MVSLSMFIFFQRLVKQLDSNFYTVYKQRLPKNGLSSQEFSSLYGSFFSYPAAAKYNKDPFTLFFCC